MRYRNPTEASIQPPLPTPLEQPFETRISRAAATPMSVSDPFLENAPCSPWW